MSTLTGYILFSSGNGPCKREIPSAETCGVETIRAYIDCSLNNNMLLTSYTPKYKI